MWIILLTSLSLVAGKPGTLELKNVPDGSELFVEGVGCTIKVEGTTLSGPDGCAFTAAVVTAEGGVTRIKGELPRAAYDEDLPMAAPAPVATTSQPSVAPERRPAPAKETVSDAWTFGAAVSLSRDIGGFGFVTTGLNASAVWNDQVSVEVQLERGTGRAENPSLSTGESVEESLLLGLIGLRYRQRIAGPAFAFLGVFVGSGRIATDEVADERSRIPASVQPLTVLRPLAGVGWQTGPVSLL